MPEGRALAEVLDPAAAAEVAFKLDQQLRANVRRLRNMWIELARDLHRFHQAELWRDLGFKTFEEWLADPGLELERRWVYEHMAMWEQLVVQRGVDPSRLQGLQVSKVREVLPALRRGQVTVEEALTDAEQLRRPELELRYRGSGTDGRTAGPDTSTSIITEREPVWKLCNCCGSRYLASPNHE